MCSVAPHSRRRTVRALLQRIRSLGERHPRLGPWLYLSSLQYFVVQVLVSLRWSPAYSISRDTISDLGNTACGRFNGRHVCSPLHALMNGSFIVLGLSMILGSILIARSVARTRAGSVGFTMMGVGGLGVIVAGIFPENTIPLFHGIGAALPFLVGNAGLLVIGLSLTLSSTVRAFTVGVGALSLMALVLYASTRYVGLGEGGIERVVAYPQTIWLMAFGWYLLALGRPRAATPTPAS